MTESKSRLAICICIALAGVVLSGCGKSRGYARPEVGGCVYVCTGPKAKVYHHDPDCKGLSRCSASVRSVSVSEAERDYGRRPCRLCD